MKLGEALIEFGESKKHLAQLKERIRAAARHQEGEQPPEDPAALLAQARQEIDRLRDLATRINKTNGATLLPGTATTLTEALAGRASLGLLCGLAREAAEAASGGRRAWEGLRTGRSELKMLTTLDPAALHSEAGGYARDLRKLDIEIQQVNWGADLLE